MDDRGSPINGIPVINDQTVDLYKLFKVNIKLLYLHFIIHTRVHYDSLVIFPTIIYLYFGLAFITRYSIF